jgi:ankyrin repeat protein
MKNAFPLHFAAKQKSRNLDPIPVLQHFIDLGFDVNGVQDFHNMPKTPLACAARSQNIPAMRFLIKRGADPDHEAAMGRSVLLENKRLLQICQDTPNL